MAIRRALGARPTELVRYSIAEGIIIGAAGGALGCLLAWQIVALFRALPPFLLPRMSEVRLDGVVLALAAAVSIGAGLLVGLTAAIRTLRDDTGAASMTGTWRTMSSGRTHRLSRTLLVAEVAAGVVLLAGAGLLLNSFARLISVDRGFEPGGVHTFSVSLPRSYQPAARRSFHDAFTGTLRDMPGISSIAAVDYLPGRGSVGFKTVVDGQTHAGGVGFNMLSPGVFATLRIPLRGRDFTAADRGEQPDVVIVNETFARKFFPGGDPIGRRIGFQDWPSLQIIAVAADTRMAAVSDTVDPAIYLPQYGNLSGGQYVVRTAHDRDVAAEVRAAASRIDARAVVFNTTTLERMLAQTIASPKLYSATASGFALVAVTLAALGLYGVLAYSIGTRTREFGIRISLGATPRSLIGGVMREGAGAVLPGVLTGLAGAVYLSRFLEALLFGVQPYDVGTLVAVAALFLLVAALACYVPARRATRVDPVVALRAE
jgi:predicted permease